MCGLLSVLCHLISLPSMIFSSFFSGTTFLLPIVFSVLVWIYRDNRIMLMVSMSELESSKQNTINIDIKSLKYQ